jgi:hypothetical protein
MRLISKMVSYGNSITMVNGLQMRNRHKLRNTHQHQSKRSLIKVENREDRKRVACKIIEKLCGYAESNKSEEDPTLNTTREIPQNTPREVS